MERFLQDLASAKPAPGGGSASAMTAAIGASLVSMVMELSLKKTEEQQKEKFQAIAQEALNLQGRLVQLVEEDAQSFKLVMEAFKLPKESEEEKKQRSGKIQESYQGAASVPLVIMETCLKVMELAMIGIKEGNPNVITDGGVAILTSWAALEGAAMNVQINLGSIKDKDFVLKMKEKLEAIKGRGQSYLNEAQKILQEELA